MAKVVHFELPVADGAQTAEFYADVLGWRVERFGEQPYWLVQAGDDDEPGANGALVGKDAVHASPVLVAGVPDIEAVLVRVRQRGGEVVQERLPIPGIGWSAYLRDPEGNVVGLFQAETAPVPPAQGTASDAESTGANA